MSVMRSYEYLWDERSCDKQMIVNVENRNVFLWSLSSHLRLSLLAVHDLGRDDLGGGRLRARAHTFGLGDDHLGDGSGGRDDGWFGPLHGLQTLLTLNKHTHTQCYTRDQNNQITFKSI